MFDTTYHLLLNHYRFLLWVVPIVNILFPLTNEWHYLYWSSFSFNPVGDNVLVFHHGPAFTMVAIIGYLIITTMVIGLLRMIIRSGKNTRRQGLILLFALLAPALSNLLYLIEIPGMEGIDWTSVFFSLSGLLILFAVLDTSFLNIAPVARDRMIEGMTDGILVLDAASRIIDFNLASQKIFGLQEKDVGKSLATALSDFPVIADLYLKASVENIAVQVGEKKEDVRYFDTRFDLLEDHHGDLLAKIIVFRDITEHYQAEAALHERVKELKSIYDLALLVEQPAISLDEILEGSVALIVKAMEFPEFAWSRLVLKDQVFVSGSFQETENKLSQTIKVAGHETGRLEVGYQSNIAVGSDFLNEEKNLFLIMAERLGGILQAAYVKNQLRETEEELLKQQRELAKIEERQRVARDLHDSVSQSIHSIVLFSETLAATLEKGKYERALQIMERLETSAQQAHKETRLLLYEWQTEGPERSVNLIDDLEERLARVERHSGVKSEIIQEGSLEYCPLGYKEHLFWITTEALNNAMKHAQAKNIRIIIRCSPEKMELDIMDDGIGFQANKTNIAGMGLENMRARAKLIHGEVTIESKLGEGTTVHVFGKTQME